ncbi:MAG: DinB family protein [Chloroflexota bacterium]|nr:DinB family protein [Chloroflexota bacterium]
MIPDFAAVERHELTLIEWAHREGVTTVAQLRSFTVTVLDEIAAILGDADDSDVIFIPHDPLADDGNAPEHERHQGWSLAHLIVHTTATAEEWAAVSSLLARGIAYPREPRLRYETDWHSLTTRAGVDQRLAESRRMCLGYLDAFPDAPLLAVEREMSERFTELFGRMNAIAGYLMGLRHEIGHLEQMRDAARQARAAINPL